MHDYPHAARVWWWLATLIGAAALAASLIGVARLDPALHVAIMVGVAFAAFAGLVPIVIPGMKLSVSVAEIPVFLLLLGVGPDAAVVAAAAEAACIALRTSKRWTSWIASPAMAAIAMYASGHLYATAAGALAAGAPPTLVVRLIVLVVVAALYFAVGTLLVGSLLELKRARPLRPLAILRPHAWLALGYASGALIAGLLYASFGRIDPMVAIVVLMFTPVLWMMLHLYYRQQDAPAA